MGDLESYYENVNDKSLYGDFRFFVYPYTLKKARKDLKGIIQNNKAGKNDVFVVDINGEAIGEIGLEEIKPKLRAELYYWIGKNYQGKGFITEAIKLISKYAFKKHGLRRIEAYGRMHNKASARVLEKSGFKREGVLRKRTLRYGKYYDDFIYAKIKN